MPLPIRTGCLLLALATGACGPKIDRGLVPVQQAMNAVEIEPMDGGSWELHLVSGGSRWDPIGKEGAGATALDLANGGRFRLTVDRDGAHLSGGACSDPSTCVDGLAEVLAGARLAALSPGRLEMHLDDVVRNNPCSHEALSLPSCARDVWFSLAYEGHPYGNPTWGRTGALPTLTLADLTEVLATRITRSTVVARANPKLADALAAELAALPASLPPDPAMKGPPVPRGPTLAVGHVPGEAALLAVGTAMPRAASEPTGALPDPERSARAVAVGACLRDALSVPDSAIQPLSPAPLGHPAVGAVVGPVDAARALATVDGLPDALAGLSRTCDALAEAPDGPLDLDAITVVVLWPEGIEDPWPEGVQAGIGPVLRLDDEDWLR